MRTLEDRDIEAVARDLHRAARTLHRRLTREGVAIPPNALAWAAASAPDLPPASVFVEYEQIRAGTTERLLALAVRCQRARHWRRRATILSIPHVSGVGLAFASLLLAGRDRFSGWLGVGCYVIGVIVSGWWISSRRQGG